MAAACGSGYRALDQRQEPCRLRGAMPSRRPRQVPQLPLERCPHCRITSPVLLAATPHLTTLDHRGRDPRLWMVFACTTCGGAILTGHPMQGEGSDRITHLYPAPTLISEDIPKRARDYLNDALDSLQTPTASTIVSASAVDAMLKEKGYKEGSLKARIEKAAADHLITKDMAEWAHEVRLDANEQRHADEAAPLPTIQDARRTFLFALVLADLLFSLPARVTRGRAGQGPLPQAPPPTGAGGGGQGGGPKKVK